MGEGLRRNATQTERQERPQRLPLFQVLPTLFANGSSMAVGFPHRSRARWTDTQLRYVLLKRDIGSVEKIAGTLGISIRAVYKVLEACPMELLRRADRSDPHLRCPDWISELSPQ